MKKEVLFKLWKGNIFELLCGESVYRLGFRVLTLYASGHFSLLFVYITLGPQAYLLPTFIVYKYHQKIVKKYFKYIFIAEYKEKEDSREAKPTVQRRAF